MAHRISSSWQKLTWPESATCNKDIFTCHHQRSSSRWTVVLHPAFKDRHRSAFWDQSSSDDLWGTPDDQAQLEASIAVPPEWVSHPRRHKLKICKLYPEKDSEKKWSSVSGVPSRRKQFRFTPYIMHVYLKPGDVSRCPLKATSFIHSQFHIHLWYPGMQPGCPLTTTHLSRHHQTICIPT